MFPTELANKCNQYYPLVTTSDSTRVIIKEGATVYKTDTATVHDVVTNEKVVTITNTVSKHDTVLQTRTVTVEDSRKIQMANDARDKAIAQAVAANTRADTLKGERNKAIKVGAILGVIVIAFVGIKIFKFVG